MREAFPSVATGTEVTEGDITPQRALRVTSEMHDDGVLFGDGLEEDALRFEWGVTAEVRVAERRLRLVAA